MESEDTRKIDQAYSQLFQLVYVQNSLLEQVRVSQQEIKLLNQLTAYEVFLYFKDLFLQILNFKKQAKISILTNPQQQSEKLEQRVQKLQAESRKHIRLEHQLKLHLENAQQKIDQAQIEIKQHKNQLETLKNSFEYQQYIQKISQFQNQYQQKVKRLENQAEMLQRKIEKKDLEYEKLRAKYLKLQKNMPQSLVSNIPIPQKTPEQKAVQFQYLQQKLRESNRNRSSWGSFGEVDSSLLNKENRPPIGRPKVQRHNSLGRLSKQGKQNILNIKQSTLNKY